VNSQDHIKNEIKEVFESLIDNYFSQENPSKDKGQKGSQFSFQKLLPSKQQEYEFNYHLKNLEKCISDIKRNPRVDGVNKSTKEKRVIIWGVTDYESLLNNMMTAI
jgi:hypothetical protein